MFYWCLIGLFNVYKLQHLFLQTKRCEENADIIKIIKLED